MAALAAIISGFGFAWSGIQITDPGANSGSLPLEPSYGLNIETLERELSENWIPDPSEALLLRVVTRADANDVALNSIKSIAGAGMSVVTSSLSLVGKYEGVKKILADTLSDSESMVVQQVRLTRLSGEDDVVGDIEVRLFGESSVSEGHLEMRNNGRPQPKAGQRLTSNQPAPLNLKLKPARRDIFATKKQPRVPTVSVAALAAISPMSLFQMPAPSFQYRYLGRMQQPDGSEAVYLARETDGRSLMIAAGDALEGGFLVSSISQDEVEVLHPESDTRYIISIPDTPVQ